MARPAGIPDHIPDSLVWDGDFHAYLNELDDPYLAGARFQDGPGIIWVTNASYGTPSWVFTRHALIEEGFANARVFSSKRGPITAAVLDPSWMLLPVEADAPEHAHFRDILRPYFTPKAMDERLEEVEGLCRSLIDAFIDRGTCEFIGEFAEILPNAIAPSGKVRALYCGIARPKLEEMIGGPPIPTGRTGRNSSSCGRRSSNCSSTGSTRNCARIVSARNWRSKRTSAPCASN